MPPPLSVSSRDSSQTADHRIKSPRYSSSACDKSVRLTSHSAQAQPHPAPRTHSCVMVPHVEDAWEDTVRRSL